ncbi:MAG: ATP/GTP-binding protein, partial [Candidatus Thermoplasmatota archaeon]|nr:ATP/GTP-binding protein [Candidatus Thermoplasmatota archaeon]MBU1941241.1 ATP/GTP-binding protein [Candidatus Thermoplasmatota archaeon]
MKQNIFLYFMGTAGSGKTTLVYTFLKWCQLHSLDAITVNLDPGVTSLPYKPDIDIRDWISLSEVMETHDLGPNGAQIACADMIALNVGEIKDQIESFKSDFILIDIPGQLELFVFREAGRYTVNALNPEKTMINYLIDPGLAHSPSGFVSQILLSLTTNFRLGMPQINILSKTDLLTEEDLDIILRWAKEPDELLDAVMNETASMYQQINQGILRLIQDFGGYTTLVPYSNTSMDSITDIYTMVQQQFEAGE